DGVLRGRRQREARRLLHARRRAARRPRRLPHGSAHVLLELVAGEVMDRSVRLVRALLIAAGVVAGGTATADTPAVTFSRDVAPLLQQHCQECHRPGGAAPFALSAYEHVYHRRDKILE